MRQLSPLTNLVLVLLLAAGVGLSLGLPWYAEPLPVDPASEIGPVETAADAIAGWFGESGAEVTGADAVPTLRLILLGLAAGGTVLALAMALAPVRALVRTPLKLIPMGVPAVVAVAILDAPDGLGLRWGIFAALAVGLLFANSAFHGAELRDPKPRPAAYGSGRAGAL